MNRKLIITVLTSLISVAPVFAQEAPKDMKLFLLIGQSNMAGRGKIEEQDKVENPNIFMKRLHYDSADYRALGKRYAEAFLKMEAK